MAERQAKGKKSDRSKKRGAGRGLSLTFILWAGFSFYALIIIFVYGAVQNMLVNKRYREQTVNELRSAGSAVTQALENNSVWREDELPARRACLCAGRGRAGSASPLSRRFYASRYGDPRKTAGKRGERYCVSAFGG